MVFLVRYLSPDEYAVLAILSVLPGLLSMFLGFGYNQYILRYFPALKEKNIISDKFWNIIIQRGLIVFIVSILLIITFQYYCNTINLSGYKKHFILYLVIVFTQFSEDTSYSLFNARFLQKYILYLTILYHLSRTLTIYFGALFDKDLIFFIEAFVVISVIKFFIASYLIIRHFGCPNLLNINVISINESQEEKKFRRISYINEFGISFLKTDIDRYILAAFSTNIQVAIYALTTSVLKKIGNFIPHVMFKQMLGPVIFSKFDNTKSEKTLNKMFQFVINLDLSFTIIYVGFFIPIGKELLELVFNQEYAKEAYQPMLIILFFFIFNSIQPGLVTLAVKKPVILLISKIAGIFNILIGIPLAYKYGASGMAFATALSAFTKSMIVYYLTKRYVKITIPLSSLIKWLINTSCLAGSMYAFLYFVPVHFMFSVPVGIVIYIILIKLIPILNELEKDILYKLTPNWINKYIKFII